MLGLLLLVVLALWGSLGEVYRVSFAINQTCMALSCRLNPESASAKLLLANLGASCHRELCGLIKLAAVPEIKFQSIERALVVFVASSEEQQRISLPFPQREWFAMVNKEHAGKALLFDKGVGLDLPPLELNRLRHRLPSMRKEAVCADLDGEGLLEQCVNAREEGEEGEGEEGEEEDGDADQQLFAKAFELKLISPESFALGPQLYSSRIMNEFEDTRWLAVSWVPVFDSYVDGLGEGTRADALLVELAETGNQQQQAGMNLATKSGAKFNVKHRRFVALLACHDDQLPSVLECLLHRLGSGMFRVEQLVWGLGFVGDYARYPELEPDWNADPTYSSHGEMPPRREGL
ncbi:hypothetical protein BASA81_005154 [Batrachochytrium salamandrivorans]|nr:hypothetical protein BASA81_005154 [Batrachochytrium salamandrivorans]